MKSLKIQLILFLSGFALYISFAEKEAAFLSGIAGAVIISIAVETVLIYLIEKKFTVTQSSVISGLIIGFILAGDQPLWIFAAACALAILSKYLIRVRGRHIFNPAALGVFLTILLFHAQTQWRGTYFWQILLPFGVYFIYKVRKLDLFFAYGLISLGLFGTQALIQNSSFAGIPGYFSYFYIFIMMIEPKTTPAKPIGRLIFGAGLALMIFIFTEIGARFDVELLSLLIMNITTPLLNKLNLGEGGIS